MTSLESVTIRPYEGADLPAVLELLEQSLGWEPGERSRAFFEWKHTENPFGASAMWVAEHEGAIVGFRSFLRWRMTVDGHPVEAVRAVDTATHPSARGLGLFTALTLHGIAELADAGVAFVFNTPNGQSRPGYLKMGWQEVGRLPLVVRLRSPAVAPRLLRARVAADKWSLGVNAGTDALAALERAASVEAISRPDIVDGVRSAWTVEALRWRFGFAPLRYRALALDDDPDRGVAIFRVRMRGPVKEVAVACTAGGRGAREHSRLLRQVLQACGADVAVALDRADPKRLLLTARRLAPILTCRPLGGAPVPPIDAWRLTLGDVELF